MADVVRVKNVGDKPIKGAYDGTPYVIPAGESAILEVECAIKDFGDWGARNLGYEDRTQYRTHEFERIRGLYGVMRGARVPSGEFDSNGFPKEVPSDTLLEERLPKVEIYTMDGARVTTLIEDPSGESLPLDGGDSLDVTRAIEEMQAQIKKLTDANEALKNPVPQIEIPKDSPQSERPKRQRASVVGSQVAGE